MKFGQTCGSVNPKIFVSSSKIETKSAGTLNNGLFIIRRSAWCDGTDLDVFLNQKINKRSFGIRLYGMAYFTTVFKCMNIE